MKPNKTQRNRLYKRALNRMIQHHTKHELGCFGMCFWIKTSIPGNRYSNPYFNLKHYPEIYAYRPPKWDQNAYFFPLDDEENLQQRLIILEHAIQFTNP